jgi:hypothetical protein
MKIILLTALPLLLSSCFSTAINEGVVRRVSNNTYETNYKNFWRAPWSEEDITMTARNISIKNCEDRGMEFVMKSHYFESPDINIVYSCIDYSDKSVATENLRKESKLAITKLEDFVSNKGLHKIDNPPIKKYKSNGSGNSGFSNLLNALASGYNQANQNMLNSIQKQNAGDQNTGVWGSPRMAPDGSWVGGNPRMAPDGSWVGGNGAITMCSDGTWVSGRCKMASDGSWVGM